MAFDIIRVCYLAYGVCRTTEYRYPCNSSQYPYSSQMLQLDWPNNVVYGPLRGDDVSGRRVDWILVVAGIGEAPRLVWTSAGIPWSLDTTWFDTGVIHRPVAVRKKRPGSGAATLFVASASSDLR